MLFFSCCVTKLLYSYVVKYFLLVYVFLCLVSKYIEQMKVTRWRVGEEFLQEGKLRMAILRLGNCFSFTHLSFPFWNYSVFYFQNRNPFTHHWMPVVSYETQNEIAPLALRCHSMFTQCQRDQFGWKNRLSVRHYTGREACFKMKFTNKGKWRFENSHFETGALSFKMPEVQQRSSCRLRVRRRLWRRFKKRNCKRAIQSLWTDKCRMAFAAANATIKIFCK